MRLNFYAVKRQKNQLSRYIIYVDLCGGGFVQTVIYADLLVILNIVITMIIVIITSEILKIESEKTRYVAGSLAGGFLSLIILAPPVNPFFSFFIRVFVSLIIVLLSFKVHSIRLYLKCFFMFNGVSLLLAGIMLAASMLISSDSVIANNGFIYVDFSISAVILIVCASFFLIKIINRCILMKRKNDLIFDTEIYYGGRTIKVKSFYDSGNSLQDVFTGRPVIIISSEEIKPLLEKSFYDEIRSFFEYGEYEGFSGKIRLLPVRTLGNSCFIPAFTAEKAVISGNDMKKIIEKPTIAVADNTFEGKAYSALINESVTGQVI